MIAHWWNHPAEWWQFWFPHSGLKGGIIAAIMLTLAFLALTAFAQTPDDTALSACRAHSLTIPVADPGKIMQAQEADFQKCITENIPSGQRREIALMREQAGVCNAEADIEQVREKLTTAERKDVYAKCMAPRYIVQ